jgi:hypothetical protein
MANEENVPQDDELEGALPDDGDMDDEDVAEPEILPPDGRAEDPVTGERISSADARKRELARKQAEAKAKRKKR